MYLRPPPPPFQFTLMGQRLLNQPKNNFFLQAKTNKMSKKILSILIPVCKVRGITFFEPAHSGHKEKDQHNPFCITGLDSKNQQENYWTNFIKKATANIRGMRPTMFNQKVNFEFNITYGTWHPNDDMDSQKYQVNLVYLDEYIFEELQKLKDGKNISLENFDVDFYVTPLFSEILKQLPSLINKEELA